MGDICQLKFTWATVFFVSANWTPVGSAKNLPTLPIQVKKKLKNKSKNSNNNKTKFRDCIPKT